MIMKRYVSSSCCIQKQIDWLAYYGAKNFLIVDVPDISSAPKIIAQGPELVEETYKLINLHKKNLHS